MPDVNALREAFARKLAGGSLADWWAAGAPNVKQPFLDTADDLLALPALRDVLAAAARDAEKVRQCEAVAVDLERAAPRELVSARFVAIEIRAALDGTP